MSNIQEEWRDITGYEGYYQISNLGRVKSLDRVVIGKDGRKFHYKCQIMKPGIHYKGYILVKLCIDSKQKCYKVHRLVAQAFIPNPDNLPQVNHKDEDKTNNRVENLEWCTNEYNNKYGTRIERTSKRVLQYTLDGKLVKEWPSTRECERSGFKHAGVSACCIGKKYHKTYKGYIWKYTLN